MQFDFRQAEAPKASAFVDNLLDVRQPVAFWHGSVNDGYLTIDPANPPEGVMVNAAGTRLSLAGGPVPAGWIGRADAIVQLLNVAGEDANSSTLRTEK